MSNLKEVIDKTNVEELFPNPRTVIQFQAFFFFFLEYKSLIHFELIFVYDMRYGSTFILFYEDVSFSSAIY